MIELVLQAPAARVEAVSEALLELGALSASVEDADAGTAAETALYGEPGLPLRREGWTRSSLRALFVSEASAIEAATLLLAQPFAADVHVAGLQPLADQDWVRLTQSQFAPVPITDTFWVVPSWHEPPAQATRVIRLDPGLAFGTGTHPTTRMCLRWIAVHRRAWPRVLDYGCGSGILAIGAALHGARDIDAVDIDVAAVQSARSNAAANGVALSSGTPGLAVGRYSLVLANILATPLKLLAPLLASHVERGGDLLLAGILQRQTDELRSAYAPWLAIDVADTDDGWALMHGRMA